jgi:phospholipid/cholesterol/gamma-HCH transport system substrate-binding protein
MRTGAVLETVLGFVVLVAAGAFLVYAQGQRTEGPGRDGYELTARFNTVGDLARGAEVRVAGVPVGSVRAVELDPDTYFARADMVIRAGVNIPEDSTAKISTAGLLGGSYVEIEPGGAMEMLEPGGEITYTQGAVDMFDLIGQAVMNRGGGGDSN